MDVTNEFMNGENSLRCPTCGRVNLTQPSQSDYIFKPDLSEREMQVLEQLARGLRSKAIGDVLHISSYTVNIHINNIIEKFVAKNRTHAVVLAFKVGLLIPE